MPIVLLSSAKPPTARVVPVSRQPHAVCELVAQTADVGGLLRLHVLPAYEHVARTSPVDGVVMLPSTPILLLSSWWAPMARAFPSSDNATLVPNLSSAPALEALT